MNCLVNERNVIVQPVQWTSFKDIDDIEPVNEGDHACLLELREVLRKYGQQDRFGVALLHSHFDLEEDEVMLETSDHSNRSLHLNAVRQSETGKHDVGTIWKLADGDLDVASWCRSYCKRDFLGHWDLHNKAR